MSLLTWAIIAFIAALIVGSLGYSGAARGAATVAKWLFGIFLVIAAMLFLFMILNVGART